MKAIIRQGWRRTAVAKSAAFALVCLSVTVAPAGNAIADPPQGAIVGWGSHVVGGDLTGGLVAVAAGQTHSLGLKGDGSIVAWGSNQPNVPAPNSGFVAVAAGGSHSLGLKADGSIVVWGYNGNAPSPNGSFIAVAAGEYHRVGLKVDGSVLAWGDNRLGQTDVPVFDVAPTALAAGAYHTLILQTNGTIRAFGCGSVFNFCVLPGVCTLECHAQYPLPPLPNGDFVAVAAGAFHSLGLKAGGSIVAWGCENIYDGHFNDSGQCDVPLPNADFIAVAGGGYHSLGLKADGSIVAWGCGATVLGSNDFGQCDVPAPNADFIAVAAGEYHSLGLKSDGSIVAWGAGEPGQTSYPNFGQSVVSPPNTGFISIAAGANNSLAIRRVPGDADADGDVDLADFVSVVGDLLGPSVEPQHPGWAFFDSDPDGDVDLRDMAAWHNVFTGD